MRLWLCLCALWVVAEGRYYHMAYAGYHKDDPTTEAEPEVDAKYPDEKDRMGILYRDPNIYQPSYHQKKVVPIEESAEIETYPLAAYEQSVLLPAPAPAPAPPTTAAAPAASEQRQQPYSYYYIGRKLWYIPLYFSLYFVIYVAALIIRAISRHKITFPDRLPQQGARALGSGEVSEKESLDEKTVEMNKLLDEMMVKYI